MRDSQYYAERPLVRAQGYRKVLERLDTLLGSPATMAETHNRNYETDMINSAMILIREVIYRLENEATK